MSSFQSDSVLTSLFQKNIPCSKFLDGSFNNNRTNFGGKAMFAKNDAINLLTSRPVQPSSKLLNNWFNGNSTTIIPSTRPMIRPM
jgi:hypothetical protein